MFTSVLIANRGEIAVRIARACRELGVRSVGVHSDVDADAPHVHACDVSELLGPASPAESYLNTERIIAAAQLHGAQAIHPGYGFLAENAAFAAAVEAAGLVFIGPSPDVIAMMGDKVAARAAAVGAGVPIVPGTDEPIDDTATAIAFGAEYGYPVAIKASFGGGGRGMRVAHGADELEGLLQAAQREANAAFGRAEVYLERYLPRARHVEVQVLGDRDGTVVHLGERDCTLQRRHQKLIEEAPAPALSDDLRAQFSEAAVRLARSVGYLGAGTCEFLLDPGHGSIHFLEMNTRLQVEHPVTELVTGIDIVQAQLRIASGDGLGFTQDEVRTHGHAIEFRINAEDPAQGFLPSPGPVRALRVPQGPWVRFDAGIEAGGRVAGEYDSMVGKLIVWGADRDAALARGVRALDELEVRGVPTTVPFHRLAVRHPQFVAAEHATTSVETEWDLSAIPPFDDQEDATTEVHVMPEGRTTSSRTVSLAVDGRVIDVTVHGMHAPGSAAARASASRSDGARSADRATADDGPEVRSPMQASVVSVEVGPGDIVEEGTLLCVLEAMKMEHRITAHRAGVVAAVHVTVGVGVERSVTLVTIADA